MGAVAAVVVSSAQMTSNPSMGLYRGMGTSLEQASDGYLTRDL
jgi:hypothetical protein